MNQIDIIDPLPAPIVPAGVDLRGYGWMPLYGNHLFGSEFNARCSDAEWRAGMTLWWAAWNQVPAASLPDDDVALTRLADLGRDTRTWKRIRAMALHGFVKCSDGRLYHPFLAKLATEAWERRREEQEAAKNEKDRKRRERERRQAMFDALASVGITPTWNVTGAELQRLLSQHCPPDVTQPVTQPVTRTGDTRHADGDADVTPPYTAKRGQERTGEDRTGDEKQPHQPDPADAGPVEFVFGYWQVQLNHPRAVLTPDRRKKIAGALKHYSPADICKAIDGCAVTPHNMGENDRGEKYDDIELILRDAKHVERFMHNADNPPRPREKQQPQSEMQRAAQALRSTREPPRSDRTVALQVPGAPARPSSAIPGPAVHGAGDGGGLEDTGTD